SRPRHYAHQPQSENFLHHAGGVISSHVRAVHQSGETAALQLSTLPRKPSARRLRFHRHADSLHAAAEEARASPRRARRRPWYARSRAAKIPAQIPAQAQDQRSTQALNPGGSAEPPKTDL